MHYLRVGRFDLFKILKSTAMPKCALAICRVLCVARLDSRRIYAPANNDSTRNPRFPRSRKPSIFQRFESACYFHGPPPPSPPRFVDHPDRVMDQTNSRISLVWLSRSDFRLVTRPANLSSLERPVSLFASSFVNKSGPRLPSTPVINYV